MNKSILWARENKKDIVEKYVSQFHPTQPESPSAIFMAGAPGTGKTEFSKRLLEENIDMKPVRIDMDVIAEMVEGYCPEKAGDFRSAASIILERVYDTVLNKGYNFILDGTLSHKKSLSNIRRALEHNYSIRIYNLFQNPEIAWQFTKDRELVEKRAIQKDGFIEAFANSYDNVVVADKIDSVHVYYVIKNEDNSIDPTHIYETGEPLEHMMKKLYTHGKLLTLIR